MNKESIHRGVQRKDSRSRQEGARPASTHAAGEHPLPDLLVHLQENFPDQLTVQDLALRYIWVARSRMGLAAEDMIGKTDHELLEREDADRLEDAKRKVLRTGRTVALESRVHGPDGREHALHASYMPWRDATGSIRGLIGYYCDAEKAAAPGAVSARGKPPEEVTYSPLAVWEEDFSHVQTFLDELNSAGETDLRSYLTEHPDAVERCIYHVRVLGQAHVNPEFDAGIAGEDPASGLPLLIRAASPEVFREEILAFAEGRKSHVSEVPLLLPTGVERVLEVHARAVPDREVRLERVMVTVIDVTPRKIVQAALLESQRHYRMVADSCYSWEFWQTPTGHFAYVSPSCESISGYTPAEFQADSGLFLQITHPEDQQRLLAHQAVLSTHKNAFLDYRIIRKDGSVVWINQVCTPLYDEKGTYIGVRGSNRNISWRKKMEDDLEGALGRVHCELDNMSQRNEQLQRESLHDPLTGLYNRRYLDDALGRELHRAERSGDPLSAVIGDIDEFKAVNDSHGHAAGDAVLRAVASQIRAHLRGSDLACRYGGEEFLLILPGAPAAVAGRRAEELRQKIEGMSVIWNDLELAVTLSFGVASFPVDALNARDLLERADQAMYRSKAEGRNRVTRA